jgi:CubicO group peptidase (beta-lactamase class C family)
MKTRLYLILLTLTLTFLTACSKIEFETPAETTDGWATASLNEVGLDEQLLGQAIDRIDSGEYPNVHSLLIVKDGKLVFEEYFSGHAWDYEADRFEGQRVNYDRDSRHTIMSVTKAFTAALVGIAIDEGFIASEQEKLFDFFPKYFSLTEETKASITLEHLLTMTSGLEWNEAEYSYSDTENDLIQLFIVEDPVAYMLAKPLAFEPGTFWNYSGGDVNLLGEVIQQSTGKRMDEFADEYLLAPLGITSYEWDFINPDLVHASGSLMLRPRDMAKFGYLILNDGVWHGEQIVPSDWVDKTKKAYIETPWPEQGEEYGYQWWLKSYPYRDGEIMALNRTGWGGQAITIFDELDMVVVFTGGNYVDASPNNEIIERYILPAVIGDDEKA